jgi:hypothetical protein
MLIAGIAIDPNNIGSIVAGIDALLEKQIRSAWPATANLPHLNAAVEANVALAADLMNVYALSKLDALAGQALDTIAKKFPMTAPEIAAIKAKIPNL